MVGPMAREEKKLRCEKREKPLYSIHMCVYCTSNSHNTWHFFEQSIFILCANLSIGLPPLAISYFHRLLIWQSEKRYVRMHTLAVDRRSKKWHHIPKCTANNATCLVFTCKFLYYIFLSPRKNVPRNRNERLRRREQKRGILLLHVYIEYIISQWVCAVEFQSAKLHFHFHVGFAFLWLARCGDA